jgi:FecR-like protein
MNRAPRIAVALSLLIAALWPAFATAQVTKAGVVTTLEGNVTAARTSATQPVALKFKDDVFVNDRVVTGDRSLARLLLGGKAVVTVRERSALTITEVPGRSTIDLDSGKVAVAVAKDKMRPGEQVEVKTPNAVAAVRGTVFIAEVIRASASANNAQGGTTANFYVLSGQVAVTSGSQVITVGPNNFATVTGGIVNSGVMTPAMRASAASGLASSGLPQVSGAQDDAKQAVMDTTIATFTAGTAPFITPPVIPPPPTIQPPPVQQFLNPGGGTVTLDSTPTTPSPVTPPPGPPAPMKAGGMLLFGDPDIAPSVPSRAALAADLRAVVPNALITNLDGSKLPADLSAYGSIWYVGAFNAISADDQAKLAQFLAKGGGVYLTGERPCCQILNNSVQSLLRTVVVGGDNIVVGSNRDFAGTATFNPTARGGVTSEPNVLTTWAPAAPGEITNISGANVLATSGNGIVAGVWNETDLAGSSGRIVLMMDVDWLSNGSSLALCNAQCRQNIIGNFATFLEDSASPLVLDGPLFRSVGEQLATLSTFFDAPGVQVVNGSLDPLIWLSGSTITARGGLARMSDSTVLMAGSFLRLDSGARVVQTGTDPLVSMSGGALLVGAGTPGHLFDLVGRAGVTQVDPDTGLIVGADQPIQAAAEAPLFSADRSAVIVATGNAYRVDTALLEATAPLLNLTGGSALTTGDHAVNLVGSAKVSIPNDAVSMITLTASALNVANGHLVNVAGGSVLNIAGNLVSLADSSTLSILNGLLLNVSGNSSASIGRSLVSFSGSGNVLNVTNSIVPTAIVNGIPVSGPTDSFRIGANAIAGAAAGTIRINGVVLTPTTPLASLTGSLVAVQTGGTVKVGQ